MGRWFPLPMPFLDSHVCLVQSWAFSPIFHSVWRLWRSHEEWTPCPNFWMSWREISINRGLRGLTKWSSKLRSKEAMFWLLLVRFQMKTRKSDTETPSVVSCWETDFSVIHWNFVMHLLTSTAVFRRSFERVDELCFVKYESLTFSDVACICYSVMPIAVVRYEIYNLCVCLVCHVYTQLCSFLIRFSS